MTNRNSINSTDDPFDLDRFLKAQEADYQRALAEIRRGQKESHWMWYIFPQFHGLGESGISKHYSIKSIKEAEEYLRHPILGPRLLESIQATLEVANKTANEIFGSPDDLKLRSCATLFAYISPAESVFDQLIEQHFRGVKDKRTLDLLSNISA